MFTFSPKFMIIAAGLMFFLLQNPLQGQEPAVSEGELREQSIAAFQEEDYRKALEGFRVLMKKFPADALFRYYTGVCMVQLNEGLDEAIELLYYASSREVPANAYYYLATAYHREYNFREAQKFYTRFEQVATRHELKDYNIKHLIHTCRTAKKITSNYNPYEVIHVTFMDLRDSLQFTQVKMKGGTLQRKPARYFQQGEQSDGLSSLMFMPSHPVRGDYLYYAGYDRRGKGGLELFRARRTAGKKWGEPEEIKGLNSDMDELLPYFDPIEDDLYFASNGREGIGGFDLYKSHYDRERDQWSEPINLGFPINSAMDEYLLLPGSDLGMMMFFSSRQGTDSTVAVYRVHISEPKQKIPADNPGVLRQIASLDGAAAEALAELESVATESSPASAVHQARTTPGKDLPAGSGSLTRDVAGTVVPREPGSVAAEAYRAVLAEALRHQAASDSLKDLVSATRVKINQSDDPNDRWVWQKQIMVWEKKARDRQELADLLYARMKEIPEAPSASTPGVIEVDTVIRDITVYRYTGAAGGNQQELDYSRHEPGEDSEQGKVVSGEAPANLATSRFDILPASPYDRSHPIPLDVSIPSGVFYRIQLGAYSGEVAFDAFGGLSPITGESVPERGLLKYYAGKFNRYEDASRALSRIRSAGYEDAFVVAWYNGIPISTQKAKQLE